VKPFSLEVGFALADRSLHHGKGYDDTFDTECELAKMAN
jgi:hypothetical protein